MMLILQLNVIIIMYELLRRKKRFAVSSYICIKKKKSIQRQKFLRKRHLLRKSRSAQVVPGSTASGGVTLKQKVSQRPGGK